jgi:hypothetical protein
MGQAKIKIADIAATGTPSSSTYYRGDNTWSAISGGTGITSINTLTDSAQTLTIGTTGTDFAIVDSGSDHKFNLPTASAINRGALSSADWTTFNNKQNTLTSVTGLHAYAPPVSGKVYSLAVNGTAYTTVVGTANALKALLFLPTRTVTCVSLYINVTVLLVAANARILIYSDLNGSPDQKLYESANLDCSSVGIKTATTTQTFTAGVRYWICVHSSSTPTYTAYAVASLPTINTTTTANNSSILLIVAFGSAPTTFGTSFSYSPSITPFVGITI